MTTVILDHIDLMRLASNGLIRRGQKTYSDNEIKTAMRKLVGHNIEHGHNQSTQDRREHIRFLA